MEKEKIIAEIIVDLYEMRVSTMNKYSEKNEQIYNDFKYSFFTCAIAQLCSKYNVKDEDVREVLSKRTALPLAL